MTLPTHICPKCRKPYPASCFINARDKPTKWCLFCRESYRDRLTSLHAKDKTKLKRGEVIDVDGVAKLEGYADHSLATLLALSHIAGAKRALAVRDGKSWRGKKAWRAYYEAKKALQELIRVHQTAALYAIKSGSVEEIMEHNAEMDAINSECDPNQKPVS